MELVPLYPSRDKNVVNALVWLHDYEKLIDYGNQYNMELIATRHLLRDIKVADDVIECLSSYVNQFNAKERIEISPIEVQIVSSADGAAHMIDPFYSLYWYENSTVPIDKILVENNRKNVVDWDKKIVLPEIKRAFEARHQYQLELMGNLSAKFLS